MTKEQPINTHGVIVDFGKHRGTPYTRVPLSYLKWMVQIGHSRVELAQAELDRRGTVTPDMEISNHAIDNASLRCLSIWRETAHDDEGIYTWLHRQAVEALASGEQDAQERYHYNGIKFAFATDGAWPMLVTVMPV